MNTKNTVTWIGIDVSKKELEIHCYDSALKLPPAIANTKTGIGNIISKLKKCEAPHLVFEATGGYEKLLLVLLQSEGIKASRITPSLARNFAKAKGNKLGKKPLKNLSMISRSETQQQPWRWVSGESVLRQESTASKSSDFISD